MDIAQDGNLFPREDLLEAVAQSDWREQPVPLAAWALAALGLGLVSFGLPNLAPLAVSPTEFSGGEWPRSRELLAHPLHALIRALGPSLGGIESLWFMASSLGLALAFLCLGAALRAAGIGARLAFFTAIASVLSPVVLGHGRLPSDFTWGLSGASLLAALVCAPSDETPAGARGYGRRLGLGLFCACLCHPLNVAAAPAVWMAAHGRGGARAVAPGLLALTAYALLAHDGQLQGTVGALFHPALDLLLLGGSLWLVLPRAFVSEREESPPPPWLVLWLFGSLGLSVASPLLDGAPSPAAVPALAVLVAGALARYARPDNAFRMAALVLGLQMSLVAASTAWDRSRAPSLGVFGLSRATPDLFQAGDVLWVTLDEEFTSVAAFLVKRRFGIPIHAQAASAPPPDAGGRALCLKGSPLGCPWVLDADEGTIARHE